MKAVRGNDGNNGGRDGGGSGGEGAAAQKRRRSNKALASSPPTTLELHGIRVQFPFRPYKCQETYMEKVLDALLKSENALLESPTGTGKTLCLLCAALAWQRQQKFSLLDGVAGGVGTSLQQSSSTALTTIASSSSSMINGQPGARSSVAVAATHRRRTPTIIYASRTHSQLSQVVRELRNTVYRPKHAVLASREQMCVHPKVKKEHHSASDVNHHCNQLCKERKCRFRNKLEGFRAPDCGETAGSAAGGDNDNDFHTQPVRDMEDLIAMGKSLSICPFYYTRNQLESAELILVPYNYLFDKEAREGTLKEVPWDNAVVIFDEAHNLESFASDSASFDLSNTDLAGCILELDRAINYLQAFGAAGGDHNIKQDNVVKLKDIILKLEEFIVNLSDQHTTYSGEFMMEVFQRGSGINHANKGFLLQELRKVTEFIMDMRGGGNNGSSSSKNGNGCPKIEHFVDCVKRVFGHDLESKCIARASYYRVYVSPKVPQAQQKTTSSTTTTTTMGRTISYWCFAPAVAMEELSDLKIRSIIVTSGTLSPLPSYGMELGLSFPHTLENPHIIADHQIHVRVVGTGVSGKELSSSYERRKDGEYYSELGNTLVSLAKVVPGGMLVFFPSYGVMETCLERWGGPDMSPSSFRGGKNNKPNRNNFFAERRRKTVATGSSRYSFNRVQTSYYDSTNGTAPLTPWKRLVAAKAVVVEPRTSGDLPDAIAEFQKYLDMPKSTGCVLMGVCRGKISEGIDFAHNMSRAVVIPGLPFAPAFDPKVKLKKAYLDSAKASVAVKSTNDGGFGNGDTNKPTASTMKLSGNEWYTQQAHRAVNQAVGRVIRNRSDYGAVLLLDSRFGQPRNQEGLSKWLRPHIRKDEGFGQAIRSLAAFYKEAKANEAKPAPAVAPEKMMLQYEEEDDDVNVTKVALIESVNVGDCSTSDPSTSAYVAPDQVLARIDAQDMMQKSTPSHPTANDKLDDQPQKPPSNDAVFDSKKPATARPANKGAPVLFMDKMKSLLSVADQSAIRKEIVTMKGHADRKDARAYRKSALVIVRLIVKCEKLETVTKNSDSAMLFLFFSLLPDAYRSDVETKAMKCVFETSTLGERCQKYLGPADFGRVLSAVVALLYSVWCSPNKSTIPRTTYLRQAQSVLSVLCKSDQHQARSMLESLLNIIPDRWVDNTRLLCDELFAAKNIENMKQKEKACVGQVTVKTERFLPASRTAVLNPPGSQMGGEPNKGSIKSESKPAIRNPYAQSSSMSRQPLATAVHSAAISKATKPSVPKKKAASLASILETVESDTFIKRTPGDIARAINSNAPENLTCSICMSPLKDNEPLIAECRHIACARCWLGWLKRSSTCPTCRVPTKKESLARAVFKS